MGTDTYPKVMFGPLTPRMIDMPSDRPRNHTVLCGARLAKFSKKGEFLNAFGFISGIKVTCCVSDAKTSFDVKYDVEYEDKTQDSLMPLEVLRKRKTGQMLMCCTETAVTHVFLVCHLDSQKVCFFLVFITNTHLFKLRKMRHNWWRSWSRSLDI